MFSGDFPKILRQKTQKMEENGEE